MSVNCHDLHIKFEFRYALLIFGKITGHAYKHRHISFILKDDQIPSFTSKRILYLQEYMQTVGDFVLPCNTFKCLLEFSLEIL